MEKRNLLKLLLYSKGNGLKHGNYYSNYKIVIEFLTIHTLQ